MTFTRSCLLGPGALFAVLCTAVGAANKEPDLRELARSGRQSLQRLEAAAASWTTIIERGSGGKIAVAVLSAPGRRRMVVTIAAMGQRFEVIRVIIRDDAWYVTEKEGIRGKYRPYEAPFNISMAYAFITWAEPHFVIATDDAGLGKYEGTQGDVATYRSPVPESSKQQLQATLTKYDELVKAHPALKDKPELRDMMQKCRDLLANGVPTRVDLKSGMIVGRTTPVLKTSVTDFRRLEGVDEKDFAVEGDWPDYSDDPTTGDLDELVIISHFGLWRPGLPRKGDPDARLLDLRTGRIRRVPFEGAIATGGCFLKGRTRVVVTGFSLAEAALRLYEINLKTGENRQLGGELLAAGFCHGPALSPDGKTLAVVHRASLAELFGAQVCLADVASGKARKIGKPMDVARLSWLPGGNGLILVRQKHIAMDKPSLGQMFRMDLDGRLTYIRDGGSAVLLNDGRTILFRERDGEKRLWKTCDLSGKNVKLLGDGLAEYAFPAPAPDGKRILMMRFQKGQAPVPHILEIGASQGKPATKVPGLWALPVWR